nr:hypothetical protein [Tanacetum cinerariifolium]
LRVDNSISNSEHESSESEESDFDNPSVQLPPPEPPDEELDFEIDFEDEISVVRNTIVDFECLNPRVEFDVSNDENDDYSYFMFVKVFSLLSVENEDTIFDPGKDYTENAKNQSKIKQYQHKNGSHHVDALLSESYYCQSNIDAARLKLKLFKNITAAEEMSK